MKTSVRNTDSSTVDRWCIENGLPLNSELLRFADHCNLQRKFLKLNSKEDGSKMDTDAGARLV